MDQTCWPCHIATHFWGRWKPICYQSIWCNGKLALVALKWSPLFSKRALVMGHCIHPSLLEVQQVWKGTCLPNYTFKTWKWSLLSHRANGHNNHSNSNCNSPKMICPKLNSSFGYTNPLSIWCNYASTIFSTHWNTVLKILNKQQEKCHFFD